MLAHRLPRLPPVLPLALALLALPAAAQDTGAGGTVKVPGGAPVGAVPTGNGGTSIPDPGQVFGAPGAFFGVGFGKDNGDWYAKTVINTDFSIGPVGLGLALPLSLLVINDDSTGTRDSKTYFSLLRKHDWDEPSDYLRFIRYVRYGHKRDPFYLLVGQHWSSTIGHGTLINRYNNTLQLDLNKVGLAVDVNTTYFGVETLTDNVTNPNLVAGRVYVRPFGGTPFLRGWAIGATVATDLNTPRTLCSPNGIYLGGSPCLTGTASGAAVLDDKGHPIVATTDSLYAFGVDTEYALLDNSLIRLVPYVDANRLNVGANGLHLGVMTTIVLPIPILEVSLDARLEYRIMQAGYIPEYFDQQYDLGRLQYVRNGPTGTYYSTKAQAARDYKVDPRTGNQGYYGELAINLAGFLQIGGTLEDYQSDNGASLGLYATFPKIEFVKIQGYYLRKNFDGLGDAFTLDSRSLLGGSVAYKVWGPMYLRAQFERTWVSNPNAKAGDPPVVASDNYGFGVAWYLPFGGAAAPAGASGN